MNKEVLKEEKKEDNKEFVIIVNAEEKVWHDKTISFEQLATIAYGSYEDNEAITYSITYKRGMGNKPEGSLTKGQSVQIKEKMIFNVTRTNRS